MLLKIINHRREQRRRRSDLKRLFQYLFSPQRSKQGKGSRLLGPPQLHKLALSAMPWGSEISEAASQLASQMDRYCRAARAKQPMPDVWYVHIIVSFAPRATKVLKSPVDLHNGANPKWALTAQNAYRIVRDVLNFFGWTPNRPSVMVAHGDRQHIHVHTVAMIPVLNDCDWDILRMSRRRLNEIAKLCADEYGIPYALRTVRRQHVGW
ncbi:MAG: hypothetical protein EOP12_02340 [Pseudomonas sp.]|nr:MAG: hypothetical protein EOP12_02340 [Pseudomonas sp.]